MFSDRVFQITFLISLIAHSAILFQNPNLYNLSANKKGQNLEVKYVRVTKESEINQRIQKGLAKKELFLKLTSKITAERRTPPPFVDSDRDSIFKKNNEEILRNPAFAKPAFIKPDIIAIKKKITLPPIDMDKINNPSYISYYQIVREKIKRSAYFNYTRTETGEAYVSFIISSDGHLKEIRLIEEKSVTSPYLKEIALRSVKDASPFPRFPKELDYPNLSFNVIISFEIE